MKKYIFIFLIIILLIIGLYNNKDNKITNNKNSEEVRAIFISYIELTKYIKNKEVEISKENMKGTIYH